MIALYQIALMLGIRKTLQPFVQHSILLLRLRLSLVFDLEVPFTASGSSKLSSIRILNLYSSQIRLVTKPNHTRFSREYKTEPNYDKFGGGF